VSRPCPLAARALAAQGLVFRMAAPQGRLRFFWGVAHSYRRYLLSPLVALKSNLVRFCLRFLETVVVSRKTQVFWRLAIGP